MKVLRRFYTICRQMRPAAGVLLRAFRKGDCCAEKEGYAGKLGYLAVPAGNGAVDLDAAGKMQVWLCQYGRILLFDDPLQALPGGRPSPE